MLTEARSPEAIAAAIGLVTSLVASYVPRLNVWWAGLSKETKQKSMAVLNVLAGTLSAFWGCSAMPESCPGGMGWGQWGTAVLSALVVNQAVKMGSPETVAVKEAKAEREMIEATEDLPGAV